ncbi:MAG: hypothetical protein JRN59_05125 [Nitrososphaerota archaeon]|nr:hypothetical protein [Nitrososphaerota archaeon]
MNQEEYVRRVMRTAAKDVIQTLLRTKEYSAKFLVRGDKDMIDKEIEKMSGEVINEFVGRLKERGLLAPGASPDMKEFQDFFDATVRDYLKKLGKSRDTAK